MITYIKLLDVRAYIGTSVITRLFQYHDSIGCTQLSVQVHQAVSSILKKSYNVPTIIQFGLIEDQIDDMNTKEIC